ncbi:unnamed protein product, partial [Allacma fusca]
MQTYQVFWTISTVITFFSNNNVFLSKLRQCCGKGLLKKARTRWNYWVDAIKRMTEEMVFEAVKKLLEEAHVTLKKSGKKNLPRPLTKTDLKKMKELVCILQPFADLTDTMQGDGITSSILIPSVVAKLKALRSVEVRYFGELKDSIVAGVQTRFSKILQNPVYVLATALDPRTKLNV